MGLTSDLWAPAPLRGVAALPLGAGMAGGLAVLASPQVRALAAEWVGTSRRYFGAIERFATVQLHGSNRCRIEDEAEAAADRDEAVRCRIVALRNVDPGALALKAAAVRVHLSRSEGVEAGIARLVERGGPFEEALALSLARDVADLFGPAVQALVEAARPGCRP